MMRGGNRLFSLALGSALPIWAAAAYLGETVFDPLNALSGRWEVRNSQTGRLFADCAVNWHEYKVSADRKHIESVSARDGHMHRLRYVVLQVRGQHVLVFVEGEEARSVKGEPVAWWTVFESPNRLRWRRDDWASNNVTTAEWRRCY